MENEQDRQWNGRDWTGFERELEHLRQLATVYCDKDRILGDNPLAIEITLKGYLGDNGMSAREMEPGVALGNLNELHEKLVYDHGFDFHFVRDVWAPILDPLEPLRWRDGRGGRGGRVPVATRNLVRAKHARRNAKYDEAVRLEQG